MERVQRQGWRDGRQVITAGREVRRHRRQVAVRPHVQDQVHADQNVEQEVTMEQPVSCEQTNIIPSDSLLLATVNRLIYTYIIYVHCKTRTLLNLTITQPDIATFLME